MTKNTTAIRMKRIGLAVFLLFLSSGFSVLAIRAYRHYFYSNGGRASYVAELADVSDSTLSHYYVHANGAHAAEVESGRLSKPPFDPRGIPWNDYPGVPEKQYNPCAISLYAVDYWELYLRTGDQAALNVFLKQADWLAANQKAGKWIYSFAIPSEGISEGWISAISQGLALSVLLRAWQNANDPRFLQIAKDASAAFANEVGEGGVADSLGSGLMWYEEYPNRSHVLNGHLYSLFGLWDLFRVTKDTLVLDLFDRGARAVVNDLHEYDTGYWAVYDRARREPVNGSYMDLQIRQLRALSAIAPDSSLNRTSDRWERAYDNPLLLPAICLRKLECEIGIRLFKK